MTQGLSGKRVLVMGLGLFGGGVGATRFLVRKGAEVVVTDLRSEGELASSLQALAGLPVQFKLGGHDVDDFRHADLVVANPAVPRSSPFLLAAEEANVPITTEICLFVRHCPAKIIGVTGSSGKTTTTMLIGEILKRVDARTLVGGNMGRSLLGDVDQIDLDVPVVLELSSFQLDRLGELKWSPNIAVVTNFAPNHIDVHGSLDAYRNAKRNILTHQTSDDWAILNADDAEVFGWNHFGERISFGLTNDCGTGVFIHDDTICSEVHGQVEPICAVNALQLPGQHNVANAMAAVGTAIAWGVPLSEIQPALQSFSGVPHRLERIAVINDVTYVNDSIATSPDRTLVALEAVDGKCILIAGGYDKKIAFDNLGEAIASNVEHLILQGQTAQAIASVVPDCATTQTHFVKDLSAAVSLASSLAVPSSTVLLSPASASYGQFLNFEARGECFKELVHALN
ncbi:MAG: UDP-N-acetylmuramoyl-L-alanine--D-glutamate ligase [Candidatus Latescibacteria bacterium]|nr:UDP-N-acetylmuramoyl-L-alanine--D-glutamate ligase [Candidatus Latescibacterota bacterium]MBT4140253.1 UDP-N-acetylmuramoyl-L-alanine--D-glutamate ligase [Candidatus Latescibacterota bacterium]MBT5829236.1 UDP-N-acetylmuramoyl-L-alanine--D-glutamate ligase [Candidatus Latescibacterota bacterium]